jgi:hypothetical protein
MSAELSYASLAESDGSRTSQPVRARAFIDLALKRLVDNAEYVLSAEELAAAELRALAMSSHIQGR